MIEEIVFMHIMHKISEETLKSMNTNPLNVLNGTNRLKLQTMNRVNVDLWKVVAFVMDGRNMNIILLITKLINVILQLVRKEMTVLIFILKKKKGTINKLLFLD